MFTITLLLFILLALQCKCEELLASTTSVVPSTVDAIPFYVEGPSVVQLPQKSLKLKVVFNSTQETSNTTFYWEVLEGGGFGSAETSYTEPVLTLINLKEGKIRWRVTVKDKGKSYFKDVLVVILPPKQRNRPPIVHINPSSPVHATEGDQVVLDGRGSEDEDNEHLEFEWKLLNGPAIELPAANAGVLRLDNLVRGTYSFGLIVKDKEGATGSGTVEVLVSPKRDDPPKAQISECNDLKARPTIDVRLPLKELLLCANTSTDDYGIVSYKWFRIDNLTSQLAVDFTGSTTAVLSLTNLQPNENVGPYVFSLTVTDGSRQNDSAVVSIIVNKAINQIPVLDAGPNQTVSSRFESVILAGTVKDDGQISRYEWTQVSGPSPAHLINQNGLKCTASDFREGVYRFRLNVTDDGGLSAVADTFVEFIRSQNKPPVARARNITVYLPKNLAVLNANESSDDAGIVRYLWRPHDDVPACITMLGDSFLAPQLLISGLLPGEFMFDLTVSDQAGANSTTTVQLTVLPGEELLNSVEMFLEQSNSNATYTFREKLKARINAAIVSQVFEAKETEVTFSKFEQEARMGKLRVVFYAKYNIGESLHVKRQDEISNMKSTKVVSGQQIVKLLRHEVNMIQEFRIESIDTLFCNLDCSGHGVCNNFSKQCECYRYWMPNLFYYYTSVGIHDCSWSMLYFGIAVFVFVILLPRVLYCLFCGRTNTFSKWTNEKRVSARRKKRRRFLRNDEGVNIGIKSGNVKTNSENTYTLLIGSDSLSSDTEIDGMKKDLKEAKKETNSAVQLSETDFRERYSTVPFD